MKILIVEDSDQKYLSIESFLNSLVDDFNFKFNRAGNANEARQFLRDESVDLLLLDIVLPNFSAEPPTNKVGLALLEQITTGNLHGSARYIVGVTAVEEIVEEAKKAFFRKLLHVISFSFDDEGWKDDLYKVIEHVENSSGKPVNVEYDTDVLLITALNDPELAAILKWDCNWSNDRGPRDVNLYKKGSIKSSSGEHHSIVAVSSPRMGMVSAAVLARTAIEKYRPRVIIMTGICGGIEDEINLGDCLIADPGWDYQSGKWTNEGFKISPHQIPINPILRGRLQEVAEDRDFITTTLNEWSGSDKPQNPKVKIAPVASGSAVMAKDGQVQSWITPQHRGVAGIDMEVYGVYLAVSEAVAPAPLFFAVKAVCDYANSSKEDSFQDFCSYFSAEFARKFIDQHLAELIEILEGRL